MSTSTVKENIVKNVTKYSVAQYITQAIGFVTSVALRNFLGPYYMGVWNILQVVQGYLSYLPLGVSSAASYQIPFFIGKKDAVSEREVKNAAFSFIFLISIITGLLLVVVALFSWNKYPAEIVIGLLVLAIYIIVQRSYAFYTVMLRAYGNFNVLSKALIFDGVLNLIFVFLLVKQFKLYGFYFALPVIQILNTMFVHWQTKYKVELKFDFKRIKALITYGFPIFLNGLLITFLRSIDRIMIAKMFGILFVGYYSVALMVRSYAYGITNNLAIVTIPYMQQMYGAKEDVHNVKKFILVPARANAYLMAPFLGFLFLIMPSFVGTVMPKYVSGVTALQILLAATFFEACCFQTGDFLITLNKQVMLIPLTSVAIILNIVLNYIFIKMGMGINGVALGTSITSCFSFFIMFIYTMKHFSSLKNSIKFVFGLLVPFVYICLALFACIYFTQHLSILIKLIVQLSFFILASLPLIFYINKETNIINIIFKAVKQSLKLKVN
ncbi:MAG: oligosaccharide flippase family protein [Candidatus Omnitrophica bacterium]|nr:oligosaccharide flippase family protein [Candidatus Omnitrophota bacterium]